MTGGITLKPAHSFGTRSVSCLLAALLTALCSVPASAAETIDSGVGATYDEAYYATTDYYGNLTEGSIVKSYVMNGASSLTDYGVYDEVVNLTDGTLPHTIGCCTTFDFASPAPSHFYFEGKTTAPFEALPWRLSMHYTLNGVPTKAEELAGKCGVVEIFFDAVPNRDAAEYARNNYTLEATAIFNQDDILSLEAEGAQIQLIGNLRAVLFVILPGEEQHFSIRVGSNDFSFGGMTFLMVPATLAQLSELATLAEHKDDIEKNYRKLSGSLDALLDSVNGISSNLYATADGLDKLNTARDILADGKNDIYEKADAALDRLDDLNDMFAGLSVHLDRGAATVQDTTDVLEGIGDALHELRKQAKSMGEDLDSLQKLLRRSSAGAAAAADIRALAKLSEKIKEDTQRLRTILASVLPRLDSGVQVLVDFITANGLPDNLNSLLTGITGAVRELDELSGTADDLLDALNDTFRVTEELDGIVDTYAPELRETLIDTKAVLNTLVSTVAETHGLLTTLCDKLRAVGDPLDTAAKETLDGLAASLRATAKSVGTAGSVKNAKNNISGIVEDVWTEYTGDTNNLLLIDANAAPQSLTDSRNASPASIQVLIRTQEIKEAEPPAEEIEMQEAAETTFFHRVAQMFKDFWAAITGIFH